MRHRSTKNMSRASDGTKYSAAQVEAKIRQAKAIKLEEMMEEHGYIFCEECGINANAGQPLDCSHTKSVKECKEEGQVELAWHVPNIKIRCRPCHREHDGTKLHY
jgi:hypothetical protein